MVQNAATRGAARIVENGHYRMNWTTGRLELCQEAPELPRGTIIHAYGAGMCHSVFAMTGEGRECVKLSANYAGDYFSDPFHTLDEYAEPVSRKFGIGFYYDLDAAPATSEEISAAIERGRAFLKEQEEGEEAARREWADAVAAVREQYAGQFEEKGEGVYYDAAHVARNVRKDLKRHFSGVKFSVRKYGYSALRIEWTGGPTEDQVLAVAGKHQEEAGRDAWNDDIVNHNETPFTDVFGGVDYISCCRW